MGVFRQPPRKGTYVLLLHLRHDGIIQVGKLGEFYFPRGYYAYAGSAFGPGGLAGRLKHHLKSASKPHWHIDYLRREAFPEEAWTSMQPKIQEHSWASILRALDGAGMPVRGFGCSDCGCYSHLVHFRKRPSLMTFGRLARADSSSNAIIQKVIYR